MFDKVFLDGLAIITIVFASAGFFLEVILGAYGWAAFMFFALIFEFWLLYKSWRFEDV